MTEAESTVAEAEEQGYYGETPDYDRDAYTLTTGPESPSSLEATLEAKQAEIDAQLAELKERAKGAKSKAKAAHEERSAARTARKEG
jgi:uncharacterized protein involved in exopolysaccharide biosynthesis